MSKPYLSVDDFRGAIFERGKHPKIRFQGREWILVSGAITTQDRYEDFADSHAHLFPDGIIRRYGREIGTKADITFLPNKKKPKLRSRRAK